MDKRKVLVIGLDCAAPELVFDRFADDLPNLTKLRATGLWGRILSTTPPITVPAWMAMMTGKSPGTLNLSGFRHRKPGSHQGDWVANSTSVREQTVWDIIGQSGRPSCVVAVPPSYPVKPIHGNLISCFLTPDTDHTFTYPESLASEIEREVGPYVIDVPFRTDERDELVAGLFDMTERRFETLKYLMTTKPWDLFTFVEIGLDRVHHAFWRFFDTEHHLYEPGSKYETVVKDYYKLLDKGIGELLELAGDDTVTIVVSDHGAKRMKGAIAVNDWLEDKGYLTLKRPLSAVRPLKEDDVEWTKTSAWGWGGYYGRVFINVAGRDPDGIVKPEDYETFRDTLIRDLEELPGPDGERLNTTVRKTDELYADTTPHADLMVFFDDLYYRAAGTAGHPSIYLKENDTGPDDAVHAWHGIFILNDPRLAIGREVGGTTIIDIAPTILNVMGEPVPSDMEGHAIDYE